MAANAAGVALVLIVVFAVVPNDRSVPTVEAAQWPNPTMTLELAVQAANVIAFAFVTEPASRGTPGTPARVLRGRT